MTLTQQMITIGMVVLGTALTRFLPFLVFPADRPTPKYIQYLGNLRFTNLGFDPIYPDHTQEPDSMRWVSQYSNANMVKTDFFEAKSTAYAKSTALIDDL